MVRQFNYITDGSHYFTLHLCGCKFNTILIAYSNRAKVFFVPDNFSKLSHCIYKVKLHQEH